jgi:nucleoside-triphosphatase
MIVFAVLSMPQNYFISGDPKSGKTTLLKNLVAELRRSGLKVGGFISPDERHSGTRTAFFVMDVESGKRDVLASVDGDGPKVSKYHVDIKSFEGIAVPPMDKVDGYDVFVIDEIGRMEMLSARFARFLDKVLESRTPLIATIHREYVGSYGASGEVLTLTSDNRNAVYAELLSKAKESIKKKQEPPQKSRKAQPESKKDEKGKARYEDRVKAPSKEAPAEKSPEKRKSRDEKERPRPSKKDEGKKSVWQHLKELIKG